MAKKGKKSKRQKNELLMTRFKYINIDIDRNMLLCDTTLVGNRELVEYYSGDDSPSQISGKILLKISEPNIYVIHESVNFDEDILNSVRYEIGSKTILRIVAKNRIGAKKRDFYEEKFIVSTEESPYNKERKIHRAKTGSVRKSKRKSKK